MIRSWRRFFYSTLVGLTIAVLTAFLLSILGRKGRLDGIDVLMTAAFMVNVTWLALGLWNSLIGLVLLGRRGGLDRAASQSPGAAADITGRIALAMTIRNENPVEVFARLRTIKESLDATGQGAWFDYYVLSDTSNPQMAAQEERQFAAWRTELPQAGQVVYRRRESNEGFKPGNLRDFCRRWGMAYEFLVLLDADSLMSAAAIMQLVRAMAANPRLGILQGLIVGVLSPSMFARVFEFGHRHGLRCALAGSAWWQDDRCQFWGHNAIIRLQPFIEYCEMPYLPGKGPFSGHVICHDQIEASFMHRAGYEVRVVSREGGSYEGIPPTVLEFMARNHRWCQGNLKNTKIMWAAGLGLIDRFHLGVVAQRFLAWPALVIFVLAAAVAACSWPIGVVFPAQQALTLYAIWLAMNFFPKFAGVAQALWTAPADYGGTFRLFIGTVAETLFTVLLLPITVVGATEFMLGLACGRTLVWNQQARDGYRLSWRTAFSGLWLQTALGLAMLVVLLLLDPPAIPWFAPFWGSLLLAVPFATLTSDPRGHAWLNRLGWCRIPEEANVPAEIARYLQLKEQLGR